MKNWNEKTKVEKILIIMRIVISIIVMIAAMIQLLGIWDKAINIAVPLLGILLIVQSIQEWKTNRGVAILGLCSAIFIFVCSFVAFYTWGYNYAPPEELEFNIQEYVKNIQEYISKSGESKVFDIILTEEIYGKELTEFKEVIEVEEVSGSIITDEKSFVTIMPMPDFLDNQSYYFEDGKLVAYKKDFMGIGGSVTYYFKDDELIFIDETKIEEEMTFVSEEAENILQRASNVYEKFSSFEASAKTHEEVENEYELDYSGYDSFFNVALINNNYELNIINETYEFESEGNKYILECKPINDNRHLDLFVNGNKIEIPGYTIKGVAVIDLDEADDSKEIVIRESQDGFGKNVVYKLNSNNELDTSTRFTAGDSGLYQFNDKFIFPITLLSSRQSPVIGYYIYENDEFKYIDRCLTGEKTINEDGYLPEKIRNEVYTFDESLSDVYKEGKELKETYSIKFLNVKLEYNEEIGQLQKRCDIELAQDAKFGELYGEEFEILPEGTVLKEVIFEDWIC